MFLACVAVVSAIGSLSINEGMAGLSDGFGYRDWFGGSAGAKKPWSGGQGMRLPVQEENGCLRSVAGGVVGAAIQRPCSWWC